MENNNRMLEVDELSFFYKILYQHETEDSHNGYNLKNLPDVLRKVLSPGAVTISESNEFNKIYYKGTSAADFMRHIRNSFAHCCITYDKKTNTYTLYDKYRNQYSMYGCVEKEILEKIITTLINTRKI